VRRLVEHDFGVARGFELGWSLIGKPWMTVHVWVVDHVLIDTGQRHMRREVVELARNCDIDAVLLTHHHEDHSANAAAVARELGVPICGHPETAAKLARGFRILPYQHYVWGAAEPVTIEECTTTFSSRSLHFEPVHTPGHSRDHTAWWIPEHGCLLAGDLYLADRIKFFRVDEDFGTQIGSLRRVIDGYDVDMLLCAHRPQRSGGRERLRAKLGFLEDLYGRIGDLHRQGLSESEIMKGAGVCEIRSIVAITGGNVSARNMVRSALRSLEATG